MDFSVLKGNDDDDEVILEGGDGGGNRRRDSGLVRDSSTGGIDNEDTEGDIVVCSFFFAGLGVIWILLEWAF